MAETWWFCVAYQNNNNRVRHVFTCHFMQTTFRTRAVREHSFVTTAIATILYSVSISSALAYSCVTSHSRRMGNQSKPKCFPFNSSCSRNVNSAREQMNARVGRRVSAMSTPCLIVIRCL